MIDTRIFASELAQEAGELLCSFFNQPGNKARYKKDRTLLTEADLAANHLLTEAIQKVFPEDHILSEEQDTYFPADGRATWVIDPLDGTTNFSQGLPHWGVSIARIESGFPETAALSFPVVGETYTAQAGKGAWLNESPLQVPAPKEHLVSFFLCDSRINLRYKSTIPYKPRILGSAAYNFCGIAKGIGILGFESIPKIWDIAASFLVLTEAGGAIHSYKGEIFPLTRDADYNDRSLPLLGAVDQHFLNASIEKIQLL